MNYDDLTPRARTVATYALLGCAFLAMLDSTVIGTALPRIVEQVGGTGSWYTWLVTAYLLTSSISVPIYGRFSDLYGRRTLLLTGLALFLAGSLACGLADSMQVLIVSRAVQGLGAGALITLGMALIRDLHPPGRDTGMIRMQTALATMMVLGMVGGPLIGGLLTDHANWRWAFWINLPLGAAATIALALVLPARKPPDTNPGRLDIAGIALLSAGLSLTLIGLSLKGNTNATWTDATVTIPTLAGLALLAALIPVERRATTPILPPHLLRLRNYAALLTGGFFFQIAILPIGVFLPLYLQHVRGYSATASGLMVLPLLAGMTISNRLTAFVILRTTHTKPALLAGAGLVTVASLGFISLDAATSPVTTGFWLLLAGLGAGPAMGGITIATQNSVPRADMGTASAGSTLTKQLGGTVGLAVAQTLLAHDTGPLTASAIGTTITWTGGIAGLLALTAILLTRDITIPVSGKPGSSH
ncbi:MFS transporter [Actinokineospora enzanensis]|uniref:MFS transporter n=1 Tax=Actinokineospora enzanensis TaxID=155975 RepID=UPI00035D7DB0|nr:MFS transporter [Actinokineospora enzanensis]